MKEMPISEKIMIWGICATIMIYCGAAHGARASVTDLDIEQLMNIEVEKVYGASKFSQDVTDAPSSVSIITNAEIRQYGWRTLADALNSVRGFYISYDTTYQFIGSRGFLQPGDYNTRYLLLVDGHKVNDNIYGVAAAGSDLFLEMDLVERIEVIRGPGSSLYGSNAFFGVINVITRQPGNINGVELSGEAGSFDTYKQTVTYGKSFNNGYELLLSGSRKTSKGQSYYFKEFDSAATNGGRADGCDDEKYGTFFGKTSYKGFTLEGGYISREKTMPAAAYGVEFNNNHTRSTDSRGYVDLKYDRQIGEETHISSRLYYDYMNFEGNYIYNYPPLVTNKDFGTGEWWGASMELSTKLGKKHTLVAGANYENSFRQDLTNYDLNPYALYLRDKSTSHMVAFHAQDQFALRDNLLLNVGARYDYYKSFGGTFHPRIAVIYKPLEKTTLKFLYGEAFRAPLAYELYSNDGGLSSKPAINLDPEHIRTYELILEQYVENYRFSLSGFHYLTRDLITQQLDPRDGLLVFRNLGKVKSQGIEFEVQGRWARAEGRLSYSYQDAVDEETGRPLINSPKHLGKLHLQVPIIGNKLSGGLEVLYMGPRRTFAYTYTGGAVVANMTLLSKEIVKGLEISGSIYNILDKKYADPATQEYRQNTIPQYGRTGRIKFTYRF